MNLFALWHTRGLESQYRRHRALLLGGARGVLHDDQLAEDAVQAAWLKLGHLDGEKIADEEKLRNLLVIVVKNTAVSIWRSRRREAPLDEEYAAAQPDPAPAPPELAERADAAARLRGALAGLSAVDQDILLLKYDNGLTVPQIAALLDLPPETVKKRLRRARTKLKHAWEVQQDGESQREDQSLAQPGSAAP